jgi:predicted site-specific integrase-resolvase
MIKVTTVTIRNYLKQGKLKGRKINGRWIISEEDANKLLRTF